jgi:hypothetical protein
MPNVPASKLWTLRLKRGVHTTLLFADPAQSLSSLKLALFAALRSAPNEIPMRHVLPESSSDIEIGMPVDLFDLSQGFALVAPLEPTNSKDMSLRQLGIKENYVLAYRFKGDAGRDDDDDETLGEEKWDVNIPEWEDTYGVENQGDLGAIRDYRG